MLIISNINLVKLSLSLSFGKSNVQSKKDRRKYIFWQHVSLFHIVSHACTVSLSSHAFSLSLRLSLSSLSWQTLLLSSACTLEGSLSIYSNHCMLLPCTLHSTWTVVHVADWVVNFFFIRENLWDRTCESDTLHACDVQGRQQVHVRGL